MSTPIYVVYVAVMVYSWIIFARIVLSWFPVGPGSPIAPIKGAVHALTEPYLGLFRRLIPMMRFGNFAFDLSAFVGLVLLLIVMQVLARI